MDNSANNANPTWRDTLPEELKAAPALQDFENVESLAKSYVNAKSQQGSSISLPSDSASDEARAAFIEKVKKHAPTLIDIPAEDADDEAWKNTFTRLGKPENYDLPDAAKHLSHVKELAEAGLLTKRQYDRMLNKAVEMDRLTRENATVTQAQWATELQTAWGSSKDAKVARISRMAIQQGAPPEFQQAIQSGDVPPAMLMFLDKVADSLATEGDNIAGQDGSPDDPRMTPEAVQAEIQDILDNPDYFNTTSRRHAFLTKRMIELQKMAAA